MRLLNKEEFYGLKTSDTIVVYGCGWSINKISSSEQEVLNSYDALSFNWFCKSKIPVKFYLVREQANTRKRTNVAAQEDIESFVSMMNSPPYDQSCLIVHDLSGHSRKVFHYHKNLHRFNHKGIVVKDTKLNNNAVNARRWKKRDIFKTGVYHGVITLTNALHVALNLRYRRIIFAGIDLYDSRYFWLGKSETRHTVRQKHQKYKSRHATHLHTLNLIEEIKKHHDIRMFVHNKRSLLAKAMKVWSM
tara:strand:- start:654 stop:1394 length:741 start_codon:yes stop_codon:yes gene_type:complete